MSATRQILAHSAILIGVCVVFLLMADTAAATRHCNPGSGKLCNPTQFPSIMKFVEGVLRIIVMIALPVISFFIVWAGFMFVKARGNSTELTTAKNNLLYVLIGTALILGAWVLATLIGETVTELLR